MNSAVTAKYTLVAVLLLGGCWRLLGLVLHDPLLGYANNHDMIRLQACHQLWPADPAIRPGASTPTAPLELYARHTLLDQPCLTSSELLFTGLGIAAADVYNRFTGGTVINIRAIGLVRAVTLALTVLLASLLFWQRKRYDALLANAALFVAVLADPGITLYLNTFYSEFSAAYFLYLSLLGLVILGQANWHWRWSPLLLAGLAGLALSKPQHMPLALLLAILVSARVLRINRWLAAALIAGTVLPVLLQTTGVVHSRDANMAQANKTNMLSALLGTATAGEQLAILQDLALPAHCQILAGTNWVRAGRSGEQPPCYEIATVNYYTVTGLLFKHPTIFARTVIRAISKTQRWVIGFYGQVAGQPRTLASTYRWTLHNWLKPLPAPVFTMLFCLPLLATLASAISALRQHRALTAAEEGLALLALLQWAVLVIAVVGDGFVDIAKHSHLAVTLLLAHTLLLALWRAAGFNNHLVHQPEAGPAHD